MVAGLHVAFNYVGVNYPVTVEQYGDINGPGIHQHRRTRRFFVALGPAFLLPVIRQRRANQRGIALQGNAGPE